MVFPFLIFPVPPLILLPTFPFPTISPADACLSISLGRGWLQEDKRRKMKDNVTNHPIRFRLVISLSLFGKSDVMVCILFFYFGMGSPGRGEKGNKKYHLFYFLFSTNSFPFWTQSSISSFVLRPLFPPFILFLCFSLAGLIRAKNKEENKGKEEAQRSDIYLQFIFLFNRKMKKIIKL